MTSCLTHGVNHTLPASLCPRHRFIRRSWIIRAIVAGGYTMMPQVEEMLAGYLSPGTTSSLKKPVLPTKPCRNSMKRCSQGFFPCSGIEVVSHPTPTWPLPASIWPPSTSSGRPRKRAWRIVPPPLVETGFAMFLRPQLGEKI